MSIYRIIMMSAIVLNCIACNTIEHKSDLPDKKPLPVIQTPVLNKLWVNTQSKGIGKTDASLGVVHFKGKLVNADYAGNVNLIDRHTGKLIWQQNLTKELYTGPAVAEGVIIVATSDALVIALDFNSGKVIWESKASSEILATPAIKDGNVYIHTLDSAISALNIQDGRQLWRYTANPPSLILRKGSAPAVTKQHIISGLSNGKIIAIKRDDGSLDWSREVAIAKGRTELQRMVDISADPLVFGDMVYAVSYQGNLVALSLDVGDLIWERDISSYSGLAANGSYIYVAATDGKLWSIKRSSGKINWVQSALQGRLLTAPVTLGNYVAVGDDDGNLHILSAVNGKYLDRIKIDDNGLDANLQVINNVIYAYGRSGKLSAIKLG